MERERKRESERQRQRQRQRERGEERETLANHIGQEANVSVTVHAIVNVGVVVYTPLGAVHENVIAFMERE